MRYVSVMVAMLAVLVGGIAVVAGSATASPYDSEETRFLQLINEYRQSNGLGTLILSDTLTVAAERHSEDMAKYGFFAHDTVSSSYYPAGSEPWDRMEQEGYDYNTYKGENLAVGYESAEEAFEAWRTSPSHNAAMLGGNYKVMGIARLYKPGGRYDWYWTTDFGGVVDPSSHEVGEAPNGAAPKPPAPKPPETRKLETLKARPGDLGGIENGSMGSGAVWKATASDKARLILKSGVARLGDYNVGKDDLRQKVNVEEGTKLAFDLRIRSAEGRDPADRLSVRLLDEYGQKIQVLKTYDGEDAGGSRREEIDLSRFAGRTVYLSFFVTTDKQRHTAFYLDNVALKR